MPKIANIETLKHRLLSSFNKKGDCWIWNKSLTCWGYGQTTYKHKPYSAHRLMYMTFVGPIPEGLELDHLCRNRNCINPEHLEPVTRSVNLTRSPITKAGINARKTHCKNDHELIGDNLYIKPNGARNCRTCRNISSMKQRQRRISFA